MFGPHLTLDFYNCNKQKLGDKEFIFKLLDELPEILGLKKISVPIVNFYTTPTPGISGFVLISESHITIHTFVEEEFAAIDIFSCKEFEVEKAVNYLTKALEPRKIEKKFFMRGRHYPLEIRKAIQLSMKERSKTKV
jgi:S-adenosylmethionine decarboxylase